MKSSNFGYIPALDHLRGFAALLVLFFHGAHFISHDIIHGGPYDPANWPLASNPLTALAIEGHTAVSLFFVLSGFVFTVGALHKKLEFVGFFRNRLLRTYPLFLFFLLLGVIFYPENLSLPAILQSLFFMANSTTAFNGGPFSFVFWSIAVEWQFYLLFPFLLLALQRWGWWILLLMLLLMLGVRSLAFLEGADMLRISYWSILGRLDQFLLGMLAGVFYRRRYHPGRRADALGLVAAAAVLLALWLFNQSGGGAQNNEIWIVWPTLEGSLWALFLLGYLSLSRHFNASVGRLLVVVGTVSYSIYLSHYVVLYGFMQQGWDRTISLASPMATALVNVAILVMPVVLLVSAATYLAIERPFLRRRRAYVQAR